MAEKELYIKDGDEIVLDESEHASNLLPWFKVAKEKNLVIKYVDLDSNGKITIEELLKLIVEEVKEEEKA